MLEEEINENPRTTLLIEQEMEHFKSQHEGEMILNDIMLLEDMGYEKKRK